MSYVNIIAVVVLFLIIGFVANFGKNRYVFLRAALLSLILIVTSYISILVTLLIFSVLNLPFDNGLFTYGLIIILLSGLIEFLLIKLLINKFFNDDLLLTIVEYFIQWMLIYLTLYQFITQNIKSSDYKDVLQEAFSTLDINTINLTLLPVMLISWIAITMIKINKTK